MLFLVDEVNKLEQNIETFFFFNTVFCNMEKMHFKEKNPRSILY